MSETPKHDALSPEMQAMINSMVSSAIREAFTGLAPVLQSIALTPEKMLEMERQRRAPDPALVAREARERAMMREDLEKARRDKERIQQACPHKDANMRWSISLIHNYPDRQTRGVCVHCHSLLEPKHWEIGAPDAQNPRGKPHLVAEHPQYHIVREIESTPQ